MVAFNLFGVVHRIGSADSLPPGAHVLRFQFAREGKAGGIGKLSVEGRIVAEGRLGRNLPLLAWDGDIVIGVCTLHQNLGGWKRHIGRVSVHVHPKFRGRGLAQALVGETVDIARACSLEKVEAEFIGTQEGAIKVFGLLGFSELVRLPDYVKDMQAITHDYVLMGLDLLTDDEYAGAG